MCKFVKGDWTAEQNPDNKKFKYLPHCGVVLVGCSFYAKHQALYQRHDIVWVYAGKSVFYLLYTNSYVEACFATLLILNAKREV